MIKKLLFLLLLGVSCSLYGMDDCTNQTEHLACKNALAAAPNIQEKNDCIITAIDHVKTCNCAHMARVVADHLLSAKGLFDFYQYPKLKDRMTGMAGIGLFDMVFAKINDSELQRQWKEKKDQEAPAHALLPMRPVAPHASQSMPVLPSAGYNWTSDLNDWKKKYAQINSSAQATGSPQSVSGGGGIDALVEAAVGQGRSAPSLNGKGVLHPATLFPSSPVASKGSSAGAGAGAGTGAAIREDDYARIAPDGTLSFCRQNQQWHIRIQHQLQTDLKYACGSLIVSPEGREFFKTLSVVQKENVFKHIAPYASRRDFYNFAMSRGPGLRSRKSLYQYLDENHAAEQLRDYLKGGGSVITCRAGKKNYGQKAMHVIDKLMGNDKATTSAGLPPAVTDSTNGTVSRKRVRVPRKSNVGRPASMQYGALAGPQNEAHLEQFIGSASGGDVVEVDRSKLPSQAPPRRSARNTKKRRVMPAVDDDGSGTDRSDESDEGELAALASSDDEEYNPDDSD